ncbi:cellulose synthase/poly-beta-1,6-N-acetylglucosamine synthase-like glycosyltransferase [Propionibacteriaceae bacterium ES.041]|uniref:glycosyltransferase family 2 protein n=1 Tax=Enemella evansiae TaxID=2016499 RepID=UPI000C00BC3D|nr:glycosyltransferase family 2 protein [Enemella evansiae]PFG66308.1 cellulose synthase/poly-beta-1,6-N-acetylglucosamine synthase-like glycosyltransferase [Propionibacteriaceae bacterium ES.041]
MTDTQAPMPTWPEGSWPAVSYVMPVLNEESYLADAVATVLDQDYPGETELVIALGPSRDNTTALAEQLAAHDPQVRIVHNPGTDIPKGLNLAIAAARHPIVIRVDAHSELPLDYTRIGVETLRRTGAANVGGLMAAAGRTDFQQAVATAYNSPLGLGGGTYHSGTEAGPCESAYLGIFRREALAEVGGYDETVRRGEDWELNLRIREAGHLVWFTPELKVTYWPRDSRERLARQFWSTGVWRGALVREIADRTPMRYFAPPALVAGFAASAAIAAIDAVRPLRGPAKLLRAAHLAPAAYATFLASVLVRGNGTLRERANLAQALAIMHTSWGAGFLSGLLKGGGDTVDTSRH